MRSLMLTLTGAFVAAVGLLLGSTQTHAFLTGRRANVVRPGTAWLSMARPKRRRRKKEAPSPSPSPTPKADENALPEFDIQDDKALPEFDLDDEVMAQEPQGGATENQMAQQISQGITEAQMATAASEMPVDDVLLDAELEKLLKEDTDPVPESFGPDALAPTMSRTGKPIGKRARNEARREAAIARKEAEENQGFFSKLPSLGGEGEDSLKPIKIIENITWAGIFLLVAWEIYLNSPFFERAAPMAPVVYELLM